MHQPVHLLFAELTALQQIDFLKKVRLGWTTKEAYDYVMEQVVEDSDESTNQEKLNFLGNGAHFSEQMNKWSK